MILLSAALWSAGLLGSAAYSQDDPPAREASVEAPVLQWIQVDGDLSDWPAAMPRYSIRKRLAGGSLGAGGLEDVDLAIVDKDVPVSPHVTIAPASIQALDEPAEDRAAFLYWGPQWRGMKVFNAGNLGELVLGK